MFENDTTYQDLKTEIVYKKMNIVKSNKQMSRVGREPDPVSSGFGINAGVIAQQYKNITRLFLCKNALVENSGQNPHKAIKIDPNKFKSVPAPSPHLMAPGRRISEEFELYITS